MFDFNFLNGVWITNTNGQLNLIATQTGFAYIDPFVNQYIYANFHSFYGNSPVFWTVFFQDFVVYNPYLGMNVPQRRNVPTFYTIFDVNRILISGHPNFNLGTIWSRYQQQRKNLPLPKPNPKWEEDEDKTGKPVYVPPTFDDL